MSKLFPSIIPGSDEPFVDSQYSEAELERMDWSEIQPIAAEIESDEINGHSDRDEVVDFLVGKERLDLTE